MAYTTWPKMLFSEGLHELKSNRLYDVKIDKYTIQQYSTTDTCKNSAKCRKSFKIGTYEAYNIKIKTGAWGHFEIFCFCSHANMAASDKGILRKKKFLKKFQLKVTN